jgi:hypothetical protein
MKRSRALLRSFSVVGALAAAALALVIGILAYNSHQSQQHQPPAGPSQSGIAEHPVAARQASPQGGRPVLGESAAAPVQSTRVSQSQSSFTSSSSAVSGSSGGLGASVSAAPVQPVSCNRGLLGGLLSALGGLLGGGGGC